MTSKLARKGEDIEHASRGCFHRQVLDGVREPESAGRITGIELGRDDRSRPATDAGDERDILAPVRALVADWLADDSAAGCAPPQLLAGPGIDRFEPSVHRSIKDDTACRHEGRTPYRQVFGNLPDLLLVDGIPGGECTAIATRTRIHLDVGTDVGSSRNVVRLHGTEVHAEVVVRNIDEASDRAEGRWVPVLEAGCRRADVTHDPADLRVLVMVRDHHAGLEVDTLVAIHIAEGLRREHLPGAPVLHVEEARACRPEHHRTAAIAPRDVR